MQSKWAWFLGQGGVGVGGHTQGGAPGGPACVNAAPPVRWQVGRPALFVCYAFLMYTNLRSPMSKFSSCRKYCRQCPGHASMDTAFDDDDDDNNK